MIQFKISKQAIDKLEKDIKKSVTDILEKAAIRTYNYIVDGHDYPYWSGSYISSWKISVGMPNRDYNLADSPNTFFVPPPKQELPTKNINFGQKIYISNSTPHAYQVEVLGTPTHPHEGWFTAAHAVNNLVLSYKFKM